MTIREAPRLHYVDLAGNPGQGSFANSVEAGLTSLPKTLPSRFFYDAVGSELFERITQLPEYYLTRSEQSMLESLAPEILRTVGEDVSIVEFGSGSSAKTRLLIEAALDRQGTLDYTPIDISREFLRTSAEALLARYPRLAITALAAEYRDAIRSIPSAKGPRLFLFLGSNLGNFTSQESVEFLCDIRGIAKPTDRILLGLDLKKNHRILEAAYDDSTGVTAEFNKNILRRINDELSADFILERFHHRAKYFANRNRVEMSLVSSAPQIVTIAGIGRRFRFRRGESIHTENCHKYTDRNFAPICAAAGLSVVRRWVDDRGWYSLVLLKGNAP